MVREEREEREGRWIEWAVEEGRRVGVGVLAILLVSGEGKGDKYRHARCYRR